MKKEIKDLQEKYKKGEIKKAKYYAELAALVEAETITQDEADEAEDFDPEADKPIYTQEDVDGMISRKAAQQIRKVLKDAGYDADVSNKELTPKLIELVKIGAGKADAVKGGDPAEAAKTSAKLTSQADIIKVLHTENAILKTINKYNPVSTSAVTALLKSEYSRDLVFLDEETGEIDLKSLDRAFRKMQNDEPTLFKASDGDGADDKSKDDKFRGKGPGGAGGKTEPKEHAAQLAAAREMMGIKTDK